MSGEVVSILLIEDNPADADLLQEILDETQGFTWKITHVEQLKIALDTLQHYTFDIVLSDLSLPDARGLDSVIQLQNAFPALPVVVLTGLNDETIGLEALRQGAQDYLIKGQIQAGLLIRSIRYAIERSQTQRVLQQQSAAMAASTEGIAILNAKREYIYVNEAFIKLHGYQNSDDLLGMTLDKLYEQSHYKSLWEVVEPVIQQQGYWRGEVATRCCRIDSNQEMSYQELLISSLADGGYVCNTQDITDRKRGEVEVLQALEREKELNELKSKFVSIVSHEFRTPLTTILSSVELLQKYGYHVSAEKNQVRFHRIINGVHRMTQLLNDVLIFNKAEAGRLLFNPKPFDVVEFCQSLIEEMQLQAGNNHQIVLINQLNGHNIYCLDEQLLNHILTNLISNGIKYSPQDTDICVRLQSNPQQIQFSISDHGIGIPPADLERLFAVFYRASNVGSIPGTGLGLAIVKQCVELHHGTVEISTEVDQGTEFRITIPIGLGV